ncbi:MAG: hypothetical protein H7327_07015 [Herminiimonas sp.]|nr:hypothetical protein [Herminiimonas sp.]
MALVTAATIACAATEVNWPQPTLPDDLTTIPLGRAMTMDGLPMRMAGFVSAKPPGVLLDALRRSFGQPQVESSHGGKRILGRAEGRFYLTVQIEPAGSGSKGIVSTVDLGELAKNQAAIARSKAHWLARLPAGSTVASDLRSEDGGKSARHTVILNGHGQARNRDAMVALLASDGYTLEREVAAAGQTGSSDAVRTATTLHFSAPGKEAMAVITQTGERSAIVLNTVSTKEANQ